MVAPAAAKTPGPRPGPPIPGVREGTSSLDLARGFAGTPSSLLVPGGSATRWAPVTLTTSVAVLVPQGNQPLPAKSRPSASAGPGRDSRAGSARKPAAPRKEPAASGRP